MTAHLLALTVGPVQDFIAAARRTRDLWFGSYLLSEISKATAKAVQDHGGKLIFPAPPSDAELAPDSTLNVANVIVAELSESDPATVARAAKGAARSRWRSFAEPVFGEHQSVIHADIWNDQVDDVIEFYAAWRVYSPQTYRSDRYSFKVVAPMTRNSPRASGVAIFCRPKAVPAFRSPLWMVCGRVCCVRRAIGPRGLADACACSRASSSISSAW